MAAIFADKECLKTLTECKSKRWWQQARKLDFSRFLSKLKFTKPKKYCRKKLCTGLKYDWTALQTTNCTTTEFGCFRNCACMYSVQKNFNIIFFYEPVRCILHLTDSLIFLTYLRIFSRIVYKLSGGFNS